MDILIVGGGASGMLAALTAAENPSNRVTILERQARVGRKLAATGNGRCNLSNTAAGVKHYHGRDASFVRPALEHFPVEQTLEYFGTLGLLTVTEPDGKIYPWSDQAGSVVDVLRLACDERGIRTVTGAEVRKAKKQKNGCFLVETVEDSYSADCLIIAAGGEAGGKLGGTGSGYRLLEGFGHTMTLRRPSLVQLCGDSPYLKSLKGVRAVCRVRLFAGRKQRAENYGEIQFTEFGLSGPVIFEISGLAAQTTEPLTAELDLLPPLSEQALQERLAGHCAAFPNRTTENLFTGLLQNRLGRTVINACSLRQDMPLSALGEEELRRLAGAVKRFRVPLTKPLGMDQAQVTAGGAVTSEFNPKTMESRLCPGLYACGEVLDIDGDCGGFNLQWAWSSGRLAGQNAGNPGGK